MDLNELIRTITQEVLNQLNKQVKKPCVMVLEKRDATLIAKIRTYLSETEAPDLLFLDDEPNNLKPERYLVPFMSCNVMAELATGRASEALSHKVLPLLLSGQVVEVLEFEYLSYSETAPSSLYNLYVSYEKILMSYGLKKFQKPQPDTVRLREMLITEKIVNNIKDNGASVLIVPTTAVVTPLALEAAKTLNVNILKKL